MAARPRTLPAAVAPVLVGTALAGAQGEFRPLAFCAALIGSVFIQIGTNLSNDYSDARRGADTEERLGPVRVTAGGLVPPRKVLVGTALAGAEGEFRPLAFCAALIGSVFIQIGTNLSNDYSDARRGADAEDRLGPVRVTANRKSVV